MIFTAGDIDAFLSVSGDTNPLHRDDDYARAAGYDGRIVPGVLAAISAVRNNGTLRTIRAKFAEPLYAGVDYPFGSSGRCDRFWYGGNVKRAVVWLNGTAFVNRDIAKHPEWVNRTGDYWVQSGDTFWQHLAMHWISWFVGTELPGHGGILTGFEMEFSGDSNPIVSGLSFDVRVEWHDNLGIVALDALLRSSGLEAFCSIMAIKPKVK